MQVSNLSIEQVELIRRLRNSGASLQQISEAYQVFERLDNEFGSFGLVKVTQSTHLSNSSSHISTQSPINLPYQNVTSSDYNHHEVKRNTSSPLPNCASAQPPVQSKSLTTQNHLKVAQSREGAAYQSSSFSNVLKEVASNAKSSFPRKTDGQYDGVNGNGLPLLNDSPSVNRQPYPDQCTSSSSHDSTFVNQNFGDNESSTSISSSSFSEQKFYDNNNIGGCGTSELRTSMGPKTSESAVREAGRCMLLSANMDQIKSLIRKCSMSVPLFDPCQLSTLYGFTDIDVNKFLSGYIPHEGEYGLQIVDWFVNILIKTDWFINDVLKYSQQIMMPKQLEAPDIVDFTPRRERFTFRDMHLEVLESHFKKDHYPSLKEKEMIANECNIKMAIATNCELKEKERVTHINVDHWFRNKRKEIIRRARLDKVDATKVVLPSRVKSSRLLLHEPLVSDSSVDWQGYYSPNIATQPTGLYSSAQSGDSDHVVSVHGDNGNQDTAGMDYTTTTQAEGMSQMAPSESNEISHSAYKQTLNLNPDIKKQQSMTMPLNAETSQDKSSDAIEVDIKREPLSEGENND